MPLRKLKLTPGLNRENTRYTNEERWYECDKVRFRQGTPEKIGGWVRLSPSTFLGVCRSLGNWVTLAGRNLLGVGTNLKFYIEQGGTYYDVTPIRKTVALGTNPFTGNGTTVVTVAVTNHEAVTGDFVTFSGVTGTYAALLNAEFQVEVVNTNTIRIVVATAIPVGVTGGAGASAAFQINTGAATAMPLNGWGSGAWGSGPWGIGVPSTVNESIRLWSQSVFGEDLIFGPRRGGLYYWDASSGVNARAVNVASLPGAASVPIIQNFILVSDISRFVFAFGCNDIGSLDQDPLLIRWSDQEDAAQWAPAATNQAGSLRLSQGSEIVTAIQTRQEIAVFTDTALYSLQYLGAPEVWGAQILGSNLSVVSQNSVSVASGVVYWMGVDKFYVYDGRVQTLSCDLRRFVFSDLNFAQAEQIFSGTNEGFNEVWWFYPSRNSDAIDRYVVYNYLEKVWYYGTLARTAWLDSGLRDFPVAATYLNNLVEHENGVDDNSGPVSAPIPAYIESAEFDIDDGHNFGFVWRVLPDVTFEGSTAPNPSMNMTLIPMRGSGSGFTTPQSEGGSSNATVTRTATVPIEQFTNIVYIRVRGRQMILRVASDALGVTWQLGSPRIDLRPDGRR